MKASVGFSDLAHAVAAVWAYFLLPGHFDNLKYQGSECDEHHHTISVQRRHGWITSFRSNFIQTGAYYRNVQILA